MILQLLHTVGYLTLLAGTGYVIFRHPWMQHHLFLKYLVLILSILFPFYFVVRVPTGWASARALGWPLLVTLFLLCLVMMAFQGWLGQMIARRRWAHVSQPTSYVLIAAIHNAGFVPLPILERLAPEGVLLGMFFYLLAFNLAFWALAVPIIRTGHMDLRRITFRLNPPLLGMGTGFVLAITGAYRAVPAPVLDWGVRIGELALDGALVALGGALASIREPMRFRREHWIFAGWRMVLYPAAMLLVVALPWPGLDGPLGWGLRMMLVLQATTPPATQTLVVTRAMGTTDQLHYTGGMILFSYLLSLVTIPLFVGLAVAWFA
ncbi:MAG: AEC family transporter [Alkalispirochaeta sp.]